MSGMPSLKTSRRAVLAGGLGLCAPRGHAQTASFFPGGGKFYPTGQLREWPGDTIICPIAPQSALHGALRAVQEAAMPQPVMRKFALLPTSSLHMTLFEGLDLEHRRRPFWPAALPTDAPLQVADRWCMQRLADFHTGGGHFRMRPRGMVDGVAVIDFSLRLAPADAAQDAHLRDVRDRLSAALDIRAPGHDHYRFHITLGYLIQPLTPEEIPIVRGLFDGWFNRIVAAMPEFQIGPPAFCTFRDMGAFRPILELQD
jgi:hypothetical protein